MTFAQFLFVAIDKLFDGSQNKKKMLRFKNVKFEIEKDIVYGKDDVEKLDTYYVKKEGNDKYPVFFYIHGGGSGAGISLPQGVATSCRRTQLGWRKCGKIQSRP